MGEPIVRIAGVTKRFDTAGGVINALDDANLAIDEGAFVCLLGASGCGKSTLLRLVAGFEAANAGRITVAGKPVTAPGPDRGMVFQDYGLFPWLSVRDNIGFGPAARGLPRNDVREIAARYIDIVGLGRFAEAYPHQLSGGMKQRVAIARVLANDARVVLMDEPFGALDAMTRERLQDELLSLWARTKLTIIFVTHSIEEAIFLADRVIVMSPSPGRIVADITIDLARPRDAAAPDFNAYRRDLAGRLQSHHGKVAAEA